MTPYVRDTDFTLYQGDALEVLAELPDESVHCCVTSPPYWGLRDYSAEGQIGLENTPEEYVTRMVQVFRQIRRVLRDDGCLFLNLGDSYASAWACDRRNVIGAGSLEHGKRDDRPNRLVGGLKEKDLVGIPWMVAFALRADGWWLRSDIIWAKPNPMPESVTDRPTKSHEYIFLLTKSPRYWFDQEAVREDYAESTVRIHSSPNVARRPGDWKVDLVGQGHSGLGNGQDRYGFSPRTPQNETLDGSTGEALRGPDGRRVTTVQAGDGSVQHRDGERWPNGGRNIRSVWDIATQPYAEAHFATFPLELPRRCIAAGCPPDGVVLDPFLGAGTTALVARNLGRRSIGIELNPAYCQLAADRLAQQSLLAEGAA